MVEQGGLGMSARMVGTAGPLERWPGTEGAGGEEKSRARGVVWGLSWGRGLKQEGRA